MSGDLYLFLGLLMAARHPHLVAAWMDMEHNRPVRWYWRRMLERTRLEYKAIRLERKD